MSAPEITRLQPWLERFSCAAGESLFRQGDPSDGCYFIESGLLRVEVEDSDIDSETVIGYFGPGEILGEIGFIDGHPRSGTVVAEELSAGWRLSRAAMERLTGEDPHLAVGVFRWLGQTLAERLRSSHVIVDVFQGDHEVDDLVTAAGHAQKEFEAWPDERVDALLERIATTGAARAEELARITVEVTRYGVVADKTLKNRMACLGVLATLRGQRASGILRHDAAAGISEIGAAAGVIFALIPVTNPVATALFKTLIALKARNALILSFHRSARAVADVVGEMLDVILAEAGAPPGLVSWVKDRNSRRKTEMFFRHSGVSLILATGGRAMVRSAYSSGRPTLGVGPGNAPVMICDDADFDVVAAQVVQSKSFDCGLICGAEHNLIVTEARYADLETALESAGAAVLTAGECEQLTATAFVDGQHLRRKFVGRPAAELAAAAAIERPFPIQLIVVPTDAIEAGNPFAREKMAPLLGLFRARDLDDGFQLARRLLELDGTGHTAVIHTGEQATKERYALLMPAGRILANSPASHGVVGMTTHLVPSLTLGCGTFGGTSTTDNVTFSHLLNVKRLAEGCGWRFEL